MDYELWSMKNVCGVKGGMSEMETMSHLKVEAVEKGKYKMREIVMSDLDLFFMNFFGSIGNYWGVKIPILIYQCYWNFKLQQK